MFVRYKKIQDPYYLDIRPFRQYPMFLLTQMNRRCRMILMSPMSQKYHLIRSILTFLYFLMFPLTHYFRLILWNHSYLLNHWFLKNH
jgi:hypothetical protein